MDKASKYPPSGNRLKLVSPHKIYPEWSFSKIVKAMKCLGGAGVTKSHDPKSPDLELMWQHIHRKDQKDPSVSSPLGGPGYGSPL